MNSSLDILVGSEEQEHSSHLHILVVVCLFVPYGREDMFLQYIPGKPWSYDAPALASPGLRSDS